MTKSQRKKPTHPPTPFSWKKEKGAWKKAARVYNANLMEENSKSPTLPSKRGI